MTVRSTPFSPTARAVARSVAVCALVSAIGSPAALAVEAANTTAASAHHRASHITVKPGMSLSDVAIAVTQSHDRAVIARAAKAIFEANPSAFMRGDPSRMKLGAELIVPPLGASGVLTPAVSVVAAAAPAPAVASAAAVAVASAPAMDAGLPGTPAAASETAANTVMHATSPAAAASGANPAAQTVASAATAAIAASGTVQSVPRSPAGGVAASAVQPPQGASEHGWAGAIQSSASGPVQAAASDASGAVAAGPASAATVTAGSSVMAASSGVAKAAASAVPVSSASAAGAPRERVSSLQQLLALKNRVLMDLQRHGFGSQSRRNAVGNAPNAASANAVAATPAPGSALRVDVPPASAHAPTADYFVGVRGYGVRLSRTAITAIAAIAAALAALIAGFAISGRKRRAVRRAAAQEAAASDAAAAKQEHARRGAELAAADADRDPVEAEFLAILARTPQSKRALMGLAAHYAERRNVSGFDEIAQRIWHLSGGRGPNWLHIASLGHELDPDNPLYALPTDGENAASTVSEEAADGALPDHSATAQADRDARHDAESDAQKAWKEGTSVEDEGQSDESADLPGARALSPAALVDEAPEPLSERAVEPTVAPEVRSQAEPEVADGEALSEGQGETAAAAEATGSESPHGPFPADAVHALNDLDMTLPPRVDGHPHADEHGAEPDSQEAPQEAPHEAGLEDGSGAAAPVAVAGLGAARFGALNLAFDLDLPGAENGAPAMAATPEQPTFSPEETAKIARNKLELAAEYIALGDVGGARTLIHEVIESNDPGTRDEAHALLATLT